MHDALSIFLSSLQAAVARHYTGKMLLEHSRFCYYNTGKDWRHRRRILVHEKQQQPFPHGSIIKALLSNGERRGFTGRLQFDNVGRRKNYDIFIRELRVKWIIIDYLLLYKCSLIYF